MHDPTAASKQAALRLAAIQTLVVVAAAAGWGVFDRPSGQAFALGGLALALGNAVMALLALGGGVVPAGLALGRLLLAIAGKWLLVALAVWLGMALWRWPPLPLLAGVLVVSLMHLFFSRFNPAR